MRTRIVRIGNSQGIRIPKALLEQAGLSGEVDMSVENNSLVIRPAWKPRPAWAAAFREMAARHEDNMLDGAPPSLSRWDEGDWEW
jgi:antitoxin MazE